MGHNRLPRFPSSLLDDISRSIRNRQECIRLAIKLELAEETVLRMLDEDFTAQMPFNVLDEWVKKLHQQATGPVLYRALHEIDRPDIADKFAHELLAEGNFLNKGE